MRHPGSYGILFLSIWLLASCVHREMIPPPAPPPVPRAVKVALVLGAGASKGFAHIGVLKILEANRIPVHMIVGTSVGSFVGSLSAYGYTSYQLQRLAFSIEKGDIADLTVPDNGFIKGDRLEEYVNKAVRNIPMENLRIPFYAVATDIQSGQEFVFGKGNTGKAVRASCSIPGVFRPVRIGDRTYVDGGVVSPVAVDAARRLGADVVIAVDISADAGGPAPESTMETILQSIGIMYAKLASLQLSRADVVIRPKVGHIGSSDFSKRHEAILEGEKAAQEALPFIEGAIGKASPPR
ncbi:MAG: patatin-like phospholipase family protein [Deltaproteobacteria bacterium]|nr:patatin-like phospholipase family protein [Candidatus Deferrimicrobiaceae bacterium]